MLFLGSGIKTEIFSLYRELTSSYPREFNSQLVSNETI